MLYDTDSLKKVRRCYGTKRNYQVYKQYKYVRMFLYFQCKKKKNKKRYLMRTIKLYLIMYVDNYNYTSVNKGKKENHVEM